MHGRPRAKDYATLQDAANALAPTGGTICLGAQAYGDLDMTATAPIAFQGLSSSLTSIHSMQLGCSTTCTIRGIAIDSLGVRSYGATAKGNLAVTGVQDRRATSRFGGAAYFSAAETTLTVRLDGCDVTSPQYGIEIYSSNGATFFTSVIATIQNTFVHDTQTAIYVGHYDSASYDVTVINDTLFHNQTALLFDGTVSFFNDLIVDNQVGISLVTAEPSARHGNNLLFGNTTNYAGTAVDGPGYVKADPLLDGATPPGLLAGSPARGAGDCTHAPATDYWGNPRGASVDVGAVQMP